MLTAVDLVAFGPHPDDIELFCGGIVARCAAAGRSVVVVDLTAGEAASRGTPAQRAAEAAEAASILGVADRRCLGLPDTGIDPRDAAQIAAVVGLLRQLRPTTVLAPPHQERHPDHAAAAALIERAAFLAGLSRHTPELGPPHAVRGLLHYPMRIRTPLSVLVDVSSVYERKRAAIAAHASQLGPGAATLIGAPDATDAIEARDRYLGTLAGCRYAEGLWSRRLPVVDDPVGLWDGLGPAHFFEPPA